MRDFFRASIAKGREEQGRANPLFPTPKIPRWKRLLFGSAIIIVPFGGGYFGVRALSQPQFILSNIEISGNACLDQSVVKKEIDSALAERAGLFFTRANTLLFNSKVFADRLMSALPIDHIETTVSGNTLHVAIQEEVVMVLIHSSDSWLLSDLDGHILRSLSTDEIALIDSPTDGVSLPFDKIPKILLSESLPADFKEVVYPANRLNALGELDKSLRLLGLTPDRYMLEKRKDTWLTVTTKEKPYLLYFDLENPLSSQIKILSSILSQKEEVPGVSYIDLRFGNRVYMK